MFCGKNKGEFLKHDFVVRQLVLAGPFDSSDPTAQEPQFHSVAARHALQGNQVVFDGKIKETLQAASLQCAG